MKILVTGSAGFIGYHLVNRLINIGHEVIGLDNINDYYDVDLKYGRLNQAGIAEDKIEWNKLVSSRGETNYRFIRMNLEDQKPLKDLFKTERFEAVVNLAAQAGVRYSLSNPHAYISANITGFLNVLEACRHYPVGHCIYASSSSVYGLNQEMPFSTSQKVDQPISLYAVSKKSNELMAHTYSHLFGIPLTGLRFFTVYGPWGRPDMALFTFTRAITENRPLDVFNHGQMKRDFTYVDDIVEGIVKVMEKPPVPEGLKPAYRVRNIGNSSPVNLLDFIREIERNLGKKAMINLKPLQPGDVPETWADITDLREEFGYMPKTAVETGVKHFVDWYQTFYGVSTEALITPEPLQTIKE